MPKETHLRGEAQERQLPLAGAHAAACASAARARESTARRARRSLLPAAHRLCAAPARPPRGAARLPVRSGWGGAQGAGDAAAECGAGSAGLRRGVLRARSCNTA